MLRVRLNPLVVIHGTDCFLGAAVLKIITGFKPYKEAKRVGIYLSMPTGEIQTDAIVRDALQSGKQVFVPYLHTPGTSMPGRPGSVMDMVDLRSLSDYDSLNPDNWGIPTVGADTVGQREHILENSTKESQPLDIILMPGVAFDIDPNTGFIRRLGHGKGYYDLFLHRYNQTWESLAMKPSTSLAKDVLLLGLTLKEQFLQDSQSSVPVGSHDNLLHGLVIGDGRLIEDPVQRSGIRG